MVSCGGELSLLPDQDTGFAVRLVCSFMHSYLSTYNVPGSVTGVKDIEMTNDNTLREPTWSHALSGDPEHTAFLVLFPSVIKLGVEKK